MFKGYVKAFIKIKLETSEWRNDFESEEEYRKAVKENLGIELGKIENNPGKRAVAKICLNSLWGKFGQRQNMGTTLPSLPSVNINVTSVTSATDFS